jgi:hypothetical protein
MIDDNFVEVENVENANKINLEVYSLLVFSEKRNKYIFKKRRHGK